MITVQQLEALKSGRIDLAFGRLTFNDPAIVQQVVMAETLVAAMPVTQPAPARAFDAEALARQPLILYPARPRPSYADHVLSLFRAQGLQPRVVQEANELQTALGLVAAGLGVTLVPSSVQRLHRDDVRYVPVEAPGFVSPVIMSYRAGDTSPYLARAVAWIQAQA